MTRVYTSPSALLQRLLSLVPATGEPSHAAMADICRQLPNLESAELDILLVALGQAVEAGRRRHMVRSTPP